MKNAVFWVFKFTLFLFMISSMYPWFLWDIKPMYYFAFFSITLLICSFFIKKIFVFNLNRIWSIILLIIIAFLSSKDLDFRGYVAVFLSFLPFVILLFIKKNTNLKLLSFCTKYFAIILLPSILLYLVSVVIKLPSLGQITHPATNKYIFENYFFFVDYLGELELGVRRFSSIFLEPGYLGTGSAFIIFANNFNFKNKAVIIIFIALVISLSLAGMMTFLIGFILNELLKRKNLFSKIKFAIALIVILIGIITFSKTYKSGDNALNKAFFNRLELDKNKGIKGNNRINESTAEVFEEFASSDMFWFGMSRSEFKFGIEDSMISGAGYQMFIFGKGFSLVIIYFLFYLSIAINATDKFNSFFFLILIVITFLQASYPDSGSWIVPYVLGLSQYDINKDKYINKKRNMLLNKS